MPSEGNSGLDLTVIIEGKRTRKPVERFQSSTPTLPSGSRRRSAIPDKKSKPRGTMTSSHSSSSASGAHAPPSTVAGRGEPLGSFEKVKQMVESSEVAELKQLHKLLFGAIGQLAKRKRAILEFSGFPFDANSDEYEKKETELEALEEEDVQRMKVLLGLEPNDDVIQYLMAPKAMSSGSSGSLRTQSSPPESKKRRSSGEVEEPKEKKSRESSEAGLQLQLSEESSDDDEEPEVEPVVPKTVKKRVSFEDEKEARLVADSDDSHDSGDDEEETELPEDVRETIVKMLEEVDDVEKIAMGRLVDSVLGEHPEHAALRGAIRDFATKEVQAREL